MASGTSDSGRPDDGADARQQVVSAPWAFGGSRAPVARRPDDKELDWITDVISELGDFAASQGDSQLRDKAKAALWAFEAERRLIAERSTLRIVRLVVRADAKAPGNGDAPS